MRIDILSLFPGYFKGPFDESIIGRAIEKGLLDLHLVDMRMWADDKRRTVDDRPYGGGPGMVLMAEPVAKAVRETRQQVPEMRTRVIYLSPQGQTLTAGKCRELAHYERLILLCGHYEGIDQRVLDSEVEEELSIGDYVLTNGCLPAIVLVDAIARFIPGVIGHADATREESFEEPLLDCPHFTKPVEWEGRCVPEVLLGGDHAAIAKWRKAQAIAKTAKARPDLWLRYLFSVEQGLKESSSGRRAQAFTKEGPQRLVLVVSDLKASRRFYRNELGLELLAESEEGLLFAMGRQQLLLTPGEIGTPLPQFEAVEDDLELLQRMARSAEGYEVSQGGETPTVTKVWFKDPDGYRWVIGQRKS